MTVVQQPAQQQLIVALVSASAPLLKPQTLLPFISCRFSLSSPTPSIYPQSTTMSSFRALLLVACVLLALLTVDAVDFSKYNARTGKKFLDDNKSKEGITTTASGLQYKVLETGSGTRSPGPSDQVKVHYRGTLLNGKEFDSSYKRGDPATFGVGQVIKGSDCA